MKLVVCFLSDISDRPTRDSRKMYTKHVHHTRNTKQSRFQIGMFLFWLSNRTRVNTSAAASVSARVRGEKYKSGNYRTQKKNYSKILLSLRCFISRSVILVKVQRYVRWYTRRSEKNAIILQLQSKTLQKPWWRHEHWTA